MARGRRAVRVRHPAQFIVVAFAGAILVGTALLLIPAASAGEGGASPLTALFTATSAVCVTGLVVVDTAAGWSMFGEIVILALIQLGGFGIMALSSLVAIFLSRRLGLRHRLIAAAEAGSLDLGEVRGVLIGVLRFHLLFELIATVILTLRFLTAHDESLPRATYLGLFHAVSAFNNAGFGLYEDSMMSFTSDAVMLLTISLAVIAGGLGFPVLLELSRRFRTPALWTLHTKLTLLATVVLLMAGFVLIGVFEWTNPATLGDMSTPDKVLNSWFHSVMPRTAGFNSLDISSMRDTTRLLTETLMFIGGGSASTAGGIKVSTFALLGFVMWAEARGDPDVAAFGRRVPSAAQRQAVSVALLAIGAVIASTMVVMATSSHARLDVLFEVISALGTVGLSAGVTATLPAVSQLLLVVLMLLGRVGPITLFAALVLRERHRLYRYPEERPIIG